MFKQSRFLKLGPLLLVSFCFSSSVALAAFGDIALSLGSRGPDVKVLQQKLNTLGYWCTADGILGSWTEKMVLKFQSEHNIQSTGVVGKVTSARLIQLTTTAAAAPLPSSGTPSAAAAVVNTAKQYLGIPYVWGGETPGTGFDCSGFTSYVLAQNGLTIPRTAALQFGSGTPVTRSNLRVGDLVFFTTYTAGASHTGIYLGDGNFIHASSAAGKVTISNLNASTYYSSRFLGGRRYF
ncbi:MAG TPA: NlpC/P60 family protein [Negativicutes bacterium]|nr:NlpC/P60 family protein [Negativicutes bacterium]